MSTHEETNERLASRLGLKDRTVCGVMIPAQTQAAALRGFVGAGRFRAKELRGVLEPMVQEKCDLFTISPYPEEVADQTASRILQQLQRDGFANYVPAAESAGWPGNTGWAISINNGDRAGGK